MCDHINTFDDKHTMRTTFYKFFLILTTLFTFSINATWASLIVYVDVTDAPTGYNENMCIHYYLPDGDHNYVSITDAMKRTINGRNVYRVEINTGGKDNLAWRWQLGRNDGVFGHKHLDTLYHYSNYYKILNKAWLYNDESDGIGYRTPGWITGGRIYFDNSRTKWTGNLQFVIGHGSEMHTYNLVKVDNTELYYLDLATTTAANWGINHSYYSFIANTTAWPDVKYVAPERVDQSDIGFSENYRRQGELLTGNYYVFRPQNDNQKLFDIITNRIPVYAIYQRVKIRPTDGAYQSMNDASQWPATISIKSTTSLNNYTTPVFTTESGTKNYNAEAMIAGEVVHTYTNLNSAAYTFEGWGTGEAPAMSESYTHYLARNTYVYAFFTAKSFKVTLNNQSATDSGTESVNPSYGYAMPTITLPTRTGYTFGGYYTETNGAGTQYYKADGTSAKNYDLTSTLTLYAQWTKNTYTVTLDNQGATSAGTTSVTATYDETMTEITPPTRTGYTFGGYYTETNGGGTQYYHGTGTGVRKWNIASNTTLYAKWTANTYDITLNPNGGSGGTTKVTATYDSSTLSSDITNPTQTGYTFAGWYSVQDGGVMVIDASGKLQANRSGFTNADSKWSATSNKTLYAKWTANTYTVMLDNQGATNAGTTSVTATYDETMPPITKPTRTGYTFGGYFTSENGEGTQYYNQNGTAYYNKKWDIASETTLYAKWTANEYTVNFNANGGSGTMESQQFIYDAAQNLTTNAFTRTGYTFAGWNTSKNGTGTSYTDGQSVENLKDNNNGSLTLYAQWTCIAPTNVNISGNYIVFPGETIELTVSGNNIAADATYVWKKGDQVIPGQTTATLTIPNCVAANAGNYSCTVTNGTCSASNNYTIKIYRLRGLTDPIDNWTTDFVFTKAEGKTATYLMDLNGSSSYQFKVHDGDAYYGNEGANPTMTSTNCTGWEMVQNKGSNVTLNTTISGKYIFTLDYTNEARPTISVTYPSKKTIYLNPNNIWNADNPKYLIHAWKDGIGNQTNILMEKLNDCNTNRTIYKAEIVGTYDRIIFVRCNPEISDVDQIWEQKWNQTNTLWLNVAENQFDISNINGGYEEGKEVSTGVWSDFIPYYTISYDMNTNEVEPMENVCLQDGSAWTAPTDPERIGYTFLGWRRPAITNDLTLYKTGTSSFIPTSNEQLTAQWQLNEYTVTWKVGGEDYVTDIVSVENALLGLPTTPADDALGCCADKFMGWSTFTNPSESEVFDMLQDMPSITGDMTFHAVFATKAPGVGSSSVTFGDMGYEDKQTVESITLGDGQGNGDATITFARGTSLRNDSKYYIIGNAVRAYAGNTITINATYPNTVIRKVTFTFGDGDGTNDIKVGDSEITNLWTGETNAITFTIDGSTGHRRIASIEVTVGINGNEYINYVTTCPNLGTPKLGDVSIDKNQIDVRCNTLSSMRSAAKIIFPNTANLTCPIIVTASSGFLISTDQNASAKYTSSLTISPKKSDPNKGSIAKTVYVRADATSRNATYDGSITITKTEGEEETKSISITANVNCQSYVLNTVDHLGSIISTTENFANDIIANAPNAPEPDACSTSYTFDGWSRTPIAYGAPVYDKVTFPFVMPAEDVTLYPVYICNSDYHRVTSDFGANNWAGDYLIANAPTTFVNGKTSELSVANMSGEGVIVNEVISAYYGDPIHVSLIAVEGGYVLKTQDDKYIYNTAGKDAGTSVSEDITIADNHPLSLTFTSVNEIVIKNPASASEKYFSFSSTSKFGFYKGSSIYLYKKYLYTSSLICETIIAEDAMVTSTASQAVKVNVPAKMDNMTAVRNRTLTVESDNADYFTATITETATNTYNVAVSYTPSAEDITDGTEMANITIKVNNNPVTTFQVTGRHLPADFVIAAKWGDNWYALPANIDSQTAAEGILIEVDDTSAPTKALAAPNTAKYGLKSVYTSNSTGDRFSNYGERLVFVENVTGNNKTLYNGSTTNIQVYAQYNGYHNSGSPDKYEWISSTTDLQDYTLTSAADQRTISLTTLGSFGTLLKDKAYDGMVRLLPVDNFYEPAELQVVEWKQNSVSVMYTGAGTQYTTRVGTNTESSAQPLSAIDHAVYSLSAIDLTAATNQPLVITIKDNEANTISATKLTIPAIVVGEETSTSLVVDQNVAKTTSVVVLDGATLTADATKYTYDDIVVYPGGKLVINDGTKLGMYTLTFRLGSSWGATEYEHKYPEFVLNTTADGAYTNTSGKINLDYVTTKAQYYTFVAPFEVNTKDIKYPVDIYGSNVDANNTGNFEFQYYDGAARAAGNTGWTVVEEDPTNGATLNAGQGYTFLGMPKKVSVNGGASTRQTYGIHRIPMSVSADVAMSHETTDQTVPVASNPSIKNNNSSWNLIGNPYMSTVTGLDNEAIQLGLLVKIMNANGTWTGGWHWDEQTITDNQRYIVFPSNDGQSYTAVQATHATLPAFKNFFVQIGVSDISAMSIPVPNSQVQPVLQASAYQDAEHIESDVELAMVLEQNEKASDQMDFLINNIYSEWFDYDADFTKMMNATNLNLYGVNADNLSFVAVDNNTAQSSIPIGYQVPDAGEYTLHISDKPYLMWDKIDALYVTDHEMNPIITTDIMQKPYVFHVEKAESNNTRFTVSIVRKIEQDDEIPTQVETHDVKREHPCKFIYQNKIYILRNGVVYDLMGKQITTINK